MYKQVIIVRKDLNMSHGKMAAQASHASMAFLAGIIRENAIGEMFCGAGTGFMKPLGFYRINTFDIDKSLYEQWINGSFTKVICAAKNRNDLLKAVKTAEELGMKEGKDFFLIRDSCYTELEPEEFGEDGTGRTLTCIGFAPMESEIIDRIGKRYQLYR